MALIAISDLRANLPTLVDEVGSKLKRLIITVSGNPRAVVISLEELESLEEPAEILSFPGALKSIEQAKKQIKQGQSVGLAQLEKKYLK